MPKRLAGCTVLRVNIKQFCDDGLFTWGRPIIDAHAHPRGLGSKDDLDRKLLDEVVAYSQSLGVPKMVSLGEVLFKWSDYTREEISWLNDRNAELDRAYPGFFIPYCFLDPTLGPGSVRDEVRRCYEKHGFKALKLEVCCNVNNDATDPVFEIAGELGFTVTVHASDLTIIGKREHQSDPEDVRAKALRFPETRIIMAHLTGAGVRGVWEIRDVANIAIDTSGMQPEAGIVEYAVETLGADRVIFGSDMNGRDLAVQIAQVLAAELDDDTKDKIFYRNALTWLGPAISDTANGAGS